MMKNKIKLKENLLKYKDYFAMIEFDAEFRIFHGEVIGLKDVITFQGKSVFELERELKNSVEDYLEFCRQKGRDPEKVFSGNLNLRMDRELHKKVNILSEKKKKSINEIINEAIVEKLQREI
jgi:predicted HicB family RNase H-like nuclease